MPTPSRKRVELDEFGGVVVSGPSQGGASPGPAPTPTPAGAGSGPSPLGAPSGLGGVAVGGIKGLLDRGIEAGGLVEKLVGNPMMQLVAPGAQSPAALLGLPGALETARQEFATPTPGPEQIGFMGERAAEFAAGAAGPVMAGVRMLGAGAGGAARMIAPWVLARATGGAVPASLTRAIMGAGAKAAPTAAKLADTAVPAAKFGAEALGGVRSANAAIGAGEGLAAKLAARSGGTPLAQAPTAGIGSAGTGSLDLAGVRAANAAINPEAIATQVAEASARGAVPGHGFLSGALKKTIESQYFQTLAKQGEKAAMRVFEAVEKGKKLASGAKTVTQTAPASTLEGRFAQAAAKESTAVQSLTGFAKQQAGNLTKKAAKLPKDAAKEAAEKVAPAVVRAVEKTAPKGADKKALLNELGALLMKRKP